MAKNKTTETSANIDDFINSFVEKDKKKHETHMLIELMQNWSGFEPKMWGPSIIGFGSYHYKYASGHEGDAPLIAFSPRKAAFSLYVSIPGKENDIHLSNLGKFKKTKGCIYVKELSDINLETLEKICRETLEHHA